ncbi:MAG: hypothetical protein E2O39_11630, partial [Planctomycetota bacterium]
PACSNGGGGGGSNSNNNASVSFDLPSSSAAEDVGQLVVTLSLSAVESVDVSVPFTLGGTATEFFDYTTMAVSPLEILAGDLVAQITFDIIDDDDCEADESIVVTLGSPTNADLGSRAVHMATVQDDDGVFIEIEPNNDIPESNAIGTLSTLAPGLSCQILGTIEALPGEFDLFRHEVSETTLLSIEVVPSSGTADIAFLVAGEFGAPLTGTFNSGTVGPESGTVTIDPVVDPFFHVVVWSMANNTNYEITISGAVPVVGPGTPAPAPSIKSTQRNVSFDGGTPRVAISHELK